MSEEKIQRAWKVEIAPNEAQARALARSVGTTRWVYNWTLGLRQLRAKTGAPWGPDLKPLVGGADSSQGEGKSYDYYSALNSRVDSGEEPSWVKESLSAVGRREAQADVKSAYDHALRRRKEGKKGKAIGWPKFRRRTHTKFWYSVSGGGKCKIDRRADHDYVTLTGIPGPIRVKERRYLPVEIPLATVAYSRHAGRHFLSVTANAPDPGSRGTHARGEVGIDVGLKTTLVLSDGRRYSAPKPLRDAERALARARRSVSRKYEARKVRNGTVGIGEALGPMGSSERKSRDLVASLEAEVARLRFDWQHKISSMLVKKYSLIRIEGLSLKALARGRGAKSWADIGWGEIRRQLEYKGQWYRCKVEIVDQFFPSTQLCSHCGAQTGPRGQEGLKTRKWVCPECGTEHDRDLNAAVNIKDFPDWSKDQSGVWRRGLTSSERAVPLSGHTVAMPLVGHGASQLGAEAKGPTEGLETALVPLRGQPSRTDP